MKLKPQFTLGNLLCAVLVVSLACWNYRLANELREKDNIFALHSNLIRHNQKTLTQHWHHMMTYGNVPVIRLQTGLESHGVDIQVMQCQVGDMQTRLKTLEDQQ